MESTAYRNQELAKEIQNIGQTWTLVSLINVFSSGTCNKRDVFFTIRCTQVRFVNVSLIYVYSYYTLKKKNYQSV